MSQTIGITGYATSGKDTAALALIEDGFERLGFADPLKELAYNINPFISASPVKRLANAQGVLPTANPALPGVGINYLRLADAVDAVGWDEAKKLPEVRRILQQVGQRFRDTFGGDVWVKALRARMLPGIDYVVTDVRYPNEVEMIHQAGGVVLRICRPGVGPANEHDSEQNVTHLNVDFDVDNSGDIESLHKLVRALVS